RRGETIDGGRRPRADAIRPERVDGDEEDVRPLHRPSAAAGGGRDARGGEQQGASGRGPQHAPDCTNADTIAVLMSQFPLTRYSVVSAIRSDAPDERRLAFDALVAAYWKPVFKYVRLKWRASPDEAADLTQAFFLRAFEKAFFDAFDPSRARFRTFLRTCLDGFVANTRKATARLKRGGGVTLVPIDVAEAERELEAQAPNAVDDFDAYFHREWLRALFAAAAGRLRDQCAARGRTVRYALFERYDLADDADDRPTYAG